MGNAAFAEDAGLGPPGAATRADGTYSTPEGASSEGQTPRAPRASVADADPRQEQVIQIALANARTMVSRALASVMAVANGGPDADLFQERFKATDEHTVGIAAQVLAATAEGLMGEVPIEVEGWTMPWNRRKGGYVRDLPGLDPGVIHLNPIFFQLDPRRQASVILHEATHKYVGTGDPDYIAPQQRDDDLDTAQALSNADSYAMFAYAVDARRAVEAEAEVLEESREAARAIADTLLAAVLDGSLVLWSGPYVTTDGQSIPPEVVADVVVEALDAQHPEARAEIVAAIGRGEGDLGLVLPDGLAVPSELVALIGQLEGVWE